MKPIRPPLQAVVGINVTFLGAFLMLWLAWVVWPIGAEWWGLKIVSGVLIFAGILSVLRGVAQIARYVMRDRDVRDFAQIGVDPKGDTTASDHALRRAGMVDT